MSDLEGLLAEDENISLSDFQDENIDDILNESDESIPTPKQLMHENEARLLLSQDRLAHNKSVESNEQLSNECILKYMKLTFNTNHKQSIELQSEEQKIVLEQVVESRLDIFEREELKINGEQLQSVYDNFTLKLDEMRKQSNQIKNIEIHQLKTITANLNNSTSNSRFKPAICGQPSIIYQNPGVNICVGTNIGEVAIFSASNFDVYLVLKHKSKVMAMDLVADGYLIAVGYENGQIVLWDPNSGALLKIIENNAYGITALKFYNDVKMQFVFADLQGCTTMVKVQKMLWTYQVDTEKLLPRNLYPFYQIISQQPESIIALACLEFVLVARMEPIKNILFRVSRSASIDRMSCPYLSSGLMTNSEGYTETIDKVISVCWGTSIDIYTINKQVKVHKSHKLLKNIMVCEWISRDMIIVIDSDNNLITLNSLHFNTPLAIQSTTPFVDHLVNPQKYTNSDNQEVLIYCNCISASYNTTLFYALSKPFIQRGKLLIWSEYLKLLIERVESQEGWYQILLLGLQLYWGELYCFAIHPNQAYDQRIIIGDISKDICGTFISLVGQKIEEQKIGESNRIKQWETAIVAAIQYCLECNQQQFLFNGLKNMMIKHGRYNEYLNCLEPFIIQRKLKQVPSDVLMQLGTHYKVLNKRQVIKQLLLNLDVKTIDLGSVYQICLQNELYTPLMVVCPRFDNDFITPLQKMYQKYLVDNQINMLLKCLWFIRMTFKGILFPKEDIPQQAWTHGIKQIIQWLLLDDIVRNFAIHYITELCEVLMIALSDPCLSVLNSGDPTLLEYFKNQQPIASAIVHTLVVELQPTMITYDNVKQGIACFVGSLNFNDITIKNEVLIKQLKVLILDCNNYAIIFNILQHSQFTSKELQEMIDLSKHNRQLMALFVGIDKLEIALDIVITSDNINADRLFQWLQWNLNKDIKYLNKIIQFIDKHFYKLLQLDIEQFKTILITLPTEQLLQLMNRPLQDGYMQLFKLINPKQVELRQIYIRQLCEYSPNDVLDYCSDYPLDRLEEIFIITNHKEGLGYVYSKVGKYGLAFKFYSWCLIDYIDNCISITLLNRQHNSAILTQKFNNIMQVCEDSLCNDEIDLYLQLAQSLFNADTHANLWSSINSLNHTNYECVIPLLQQLNEQLSLIFTQITKSHLHGLIALIEQQLFSMLWIQDSFKQVLQKYRIEININSKASLIVKQSFHNFKVQLFLEYANSPSFIVCCTQCGRYFGDDTNQVDHILIRKCGHSTHQSCLTLPYCQLCHSYIRMQVENVMAKQIQLGDDLMIREQLIKDQQSILSQRRQDDELQYQPTDEDLQLYIEHKTMHKMQQFDKVFDQFI